LEEAGIQVEYVREEIDDSPEARLSQNLFAMFTEYERAKAAYRNQRGAD
jgi:hypothetical protein